jgi:hypothetical protein
MPAFAPPGRYANVDFHFLGPEEDSNLPGTVVVRASEMVLNIPGGYGPYLLIGKAHRHWFEAENTAHDRQYDVTAKWAEIDGTYVGTWIEDGWEYLFSFELGKPETSQEH